MISIVLPLYNKELSISYTVKSILNQTFTEYELIIVNDGSTDASIHNLQDFKDNRFRIIHKENGGVSSARNKGIEKSRFPYVAFIDADDYWKPNYLKEQFKMISDFPEAAMWGCSYGLIGEYGKTPPPDRQLAYGYRGIVSNYFKRKTNASLFFTSALVISKHIFKEIGLFDERIHIGEDLDMWYRIILKFKVAYHNIPLVYYNIASENRLSNIYRPDLNVCMPYYIEKFNLLQHDNIDFIKYFHNYVAAFILPYFFGDQTEHILSKTIANKLNFKKIKLKYTLLYKTPYFIGYILNILVKFWKVNLKKNIKFNSNRI